MRKMILYLEHVGKQSYYYALAALQVLCILLHNFAIRNLQKPAGIGEAIKFIFSNPGGYLLAVIFGILSGLIWIALFISMLLRIPLVYSILLEMTSRDSYYEYPEEESQATTIKITINIIILIALAFLNYIFLAYLGILLFTIVILSIATYVVLDNW